MIVRKTQFFATVFRQYHEELVRFLTARLQCREAAADLTQEAFLRLVAIENPAAIREPRAFLYRVARNLAVDSVRKQQVRSKYHVDATALEEHPCPHPGPDVRLEEEQLYQVLRTCIAELPPRRQDVFVLYRFKNLTQADIAARLGISTSMVERHIMKAMAHCRKRLRAHT